MILAHELNPYDGDAHFFENSRLPVLCPACTSLLVKDYLPANVKPRKKLDVCTTYDNRTIVNERFKTWCDQQGFANIGFRQVCTAPPFYVLEPAAILRLDPHCARYDPRCRTCGNHKFVKQMGPLRLLDVSSPIAEGFYRSDVEFGDGREQSPAIIVGIETTQRLKQERFRLFYFSPVLSRLAEGELAPGS